ncbi:FeoA family protein [Mycolicibacterium sp. Dal123E01]|uniref:FeoA family protein n=1 Tax=Mycolicibacterium sp. Dal123E01 TaxID=3457578 RepID=UPI00403E6109
MNDARREHIESSAGSSATGTLAELPVGATATILTLDPAAPAEVLTRLRHLGFRSGVEVKKLRTAPLRDPALYRLLGYDTCLRRREAKHVRVEAVA